jgi:signal transduction histidine kinase
MNTSPTLEQQTPKAFKMEKPTILTHAQRLFAAPVFEDDEEKTRVARLLNIVLLSVMTVAALMLALTLIVYGLPTSLEEAFMPLSSAATLVTMGGLLIAAHRGHLQIASGVLLALIWTLITFWLHGFSKANSDSNNAMYILVIVLSGLLLDRRAAIFFTALSLLSIGIAFYPEIGKTGQETLVFDLIVKLLVIGLTGLLLGYAVNNMTRALDLARRNEHALVDKNREMEASQRVTSAASERVSPAELMGLVVDLIRDQFDLYHVQVYVVDQEQEAAVLRESTGYAGQQLLQEKHHIPLDHPALVTQAIREGQPVLVNDVSQASNFMSNPLLPDTKSELVVPLRAGDRVIGVLDVQDRVPGRFAEGTVTLFQTMTDQLTFLFENSELWERVSEQTQALSASASQLRAAAEIAEQVSTILDPERLLQQVVELLQSRFGLYHAHVYLLDTATDRLTVRAGSGEVGRVLQERGHSIPLDREKSLVARAARERGAVLVDDTSTEVSFMPNPLLPQTRSEAAVPLIVGGRVLGVLDVQDDQPGRFTSTDLDTFSTLAGQIATALQNAGLFEQVERSLTETKTRFEVSQALAVTQTEEDVLDAMIQIADFYPQTCISIFTFEPEAEHPTLVLHRAEAFESGITPAIESGTSFPASMFPLPNLMSADESFVSHNLPEDERVDPASREITRQSGGVSTAVLPINAGGEWLGVIAVSSSQEGYFDERKLYLYQSLAEQGAIALRTARLYDETQRAAQRLREMDRLKSEFLANMSHELRTPLNSILGYTELILMDLEDELDAETLQDIQAIHNNGQHLLSLINDILDLAKIEAGRMTLNLEQVALDPLFDGIKNSSAGLLVKKSIDFRVVVENDLPTVQADPIRLHQILNNLVSNAVKFTDEGYVSLHAFRQPSEPDGAGSDNGWVCIEIEDTGVGISQEDLETIFDKFQQVDGSFTRRAEGTGLGLSITRHLVQMHGGTIDVRSQPDQGSTFTVRLPSQHQEQVASATTDG